MKVQAAKNMSLGAGSTALVLRDTEMWADTVDHGPQNDTGRIRIEMTGSVEVPRRGALPAETITAAGLPEAVTIEAKITAGVVHPGARRVAVTTGKTTAERLIIPNGIPGRTGFQTTSTI